MVSAGPVARFTLTDHDGTSVTEATYAGRYLLVFFGFTHCRVVCPRALQKFSVVLNELGDVADSITPLYVTVDPDRDTPEVMRKFLQDRRSSFLGLTGTKDQIDAAKKTFRVFAERKADPEDPDGYSVPHTAILYLMGRGGEYRDHFTEATDDSTIVRRIQSVVQGDEGSGSSSHL